MGQIKSLMVLVVYAFVLSLCCLGVLVYGFVGLWVCVVLGFLVFWFLGFWVSGFLGFWVYGCLGGRDSGLLINWCGECSSCCFYW